MKKIFYIQSIMITFVLLLAGACNGNDPILFDPQFSYVAFVDETDVDALAKENSPKVLFFSHREDQGTLLKIPVGASGITDETVTVNFEFVSSDDTSYRKAVEGVDFKLVNSSRTLHFPKGAGVDTIYIQTIDNSVKDAHSIFRIQLTNISQPGYAYGFNESRAAADVLVMDDESMSKFEGDWTVSGYTVHYYDKNNALKQDFDTASTRTLAFTPHMVTIVSHPTKENTLLVKNFMGTPSLSAEMTIDEASGKVSMVSYQILGKVSNRNIYLFTFDDAGESLAPGALIEGRVCSDDLLQLWRYSIFYYDDNGQEIGVYLTYDILKANWTRKK